MKCERPFITKAEASRLSGIRRRGIYELIAVGTSPVDHKNRIPREAFMRWLTARTGASP